MSPRGEPARERRGALHIVARVGDETFAFPVADVEEAIDAPAIEWVPVAPDGMLGQLSHRGRMVGAWDAARIFRVPATVSGGAALVLRQGETRVALVVDDVVEVVRIGRSDLVDTPAGVDADGVLRGVSFAAGARAGDATPLTCVVRVDALAAFIAERGTPVGGTAR